MKRSFLLRRQWFVNDSKRRAPRKVAVADPLAVTFSVSDKAARCFCPRGVKGRDQLAFGAIVFTAPARIICSIFQFTSDRFDDSVKVYGTTGKNHFTIGK